MSDDDVMNDDYNFAEGDDVFVYFNDLLYEAKCMKRRKTEYGENQYFIHYKGWKSSWDEWIDENEVLEMSSTNYGHQARLQMKFDEKRALEESKKKKKIEKPKKKNEKPKKNISVPSMLKKRGRPRKTVTIKKSSYSVKNNKEPTTLAVKTTSQTNKNLQKRGQSKKAEPKSNTTDKKVKDKTKVINNDAITKSAPSSSAVVSSSTPRSSTMKSSSTPRSSTMKSSSTPRSSTMKSSSTPRSSTMKSSSTPRSSTMASSSTPSSSTVASSSTPSSSTVASSSTPSSSTVTSSSETTKTVKTYSNKTKKLINEVKENISVTGPSQSSNIDYCNEFQPEYEPVLKRLKTYTKNKFPETLQVNASNISDDATQNIGKQIAEKALIFEMPSQSINIDNCKLSNNAAISSSVQSPITEPNRSISINNCKIFDDATTSDSVQSLITEPNQPINIDNFKVSSAAISNSVQSLITKPDQPINIDNCKVSNDATASDSVQSLITEPTQPINTDNCKVSNDATASDSVQSLITEPNQPIIKDNTTTENDKEKSAEEQAAIRAVSNIYLNIIPFAMRLGDKLHQSMLLPSKLKKVMLDDWLVHNSNQKLYKFQDVHHVAHVAYTFTEELYRFASDSDKKTSLMLCVKFMECFNNIVHTHITFKSEIKSGIQFKAMSYFRKRLIDYPNITYVLKEHLVPKKIWCYVYGPMYLLRFIARLPFVVLTTSWNVECDIDFFVDYVNKMIRFLEDNFNTYFSSVDFIEY